jgi:curved DNA-binding protein CbpA
MMDFFALLGEPRRPWSDPDALKTKFLSLSAQIHPDRMHGATPEAQKTAQEQFTELNAAYQCLREPRDRLKHLVELETGRRPQDLQNIEPELMGFFMEVTRLCREADDFHASASKADSPLLRVRQFQEAQELTEHLRGMQDAISSRNSGLLKELKTLDEKWDSSTHGGAGEREALVGQIQRLSHLFGFCARWSAQVQERIVQLAV